LDVNEVVIGMAHRGRLNILVNAAGKDVKQSSASFEAISIPPARRAPAT